ncbi:MAG TPA: alpha/beta hydrolase domain-containing protein [Acidimicrobiales bacterium]|nr:alpha/beta hydrolase domain-containing protein [Acidimicrobiales bacterium]
MTRTPSAVFKEMPGQAPDIMRDYDLASLGYEETEFSAEGTARSYVLQGERGFDGQWEVVAGPEAPFKTRFVVRRPVDEARFSGTAVVEWHNVSAGIDAAPDWGFFHRHVAAHGHAWVGVSAQKVGIDGGGFVEGIHLKLLAPDRYNQLEHPGDAWSFDIFTQVAALLRLPADEGPLGGLAPETLLAAGESQSAACLVTYINAIDPHVRLFNGFLVHGRPGVGVSIDGVFIPAARGAAMEATRVAISSKGERIRTDARVPVLVLQSETDVILLGGGLAEQPDSDTVRVWEMAGAAHADTYTVSAGRHDDGTLSAADLAELLRPTSSLMIGTTDSPINAGPQQHYVAQAALAHLTRWATGGDPPPQAPRLAVNADRSGFELDGHGLAVGGIRTPWVDVPTAVMSGLGQSGETFAMLFGRTEPFDDATLAELYPGGRADYLRRFEAALDAAIAAGFILADDRAEILAVAAASFPLRVIGAEGPTSAS